MKHILFAQKMILFTAIAACSVFQQLHAQAISRKYAVFKDGIAFVQAQDSVNIQDGKMIVPLPSGALFGTYWPAHTTNGFDMKTVLGAAEKYNFAGLKEMLANNTGKKVRLILAYQEPLEAVLNSVMNDFAVFKSKDRWITTNIDKIETIEFLEEPKVQGEKNGKQLEIATKDIPNGKHLLSYTYMRKGLGWLPEYFLTLTETNPTNANLTLRAVLINDAEDLKNAQVSFVSGAPNFRFGDTQDPLNTSATIGEIKNGLQNDAQYNNTSIFSNAKAGYSLQKPSAENSETGETIEDLHYYPSREQVNLAKGSRAAFQLLGILTPVKHIYTVQTGSQSIFPYKKDVSADEYNTVYHKLELTNLSNTQPWTSGSIFVMKEANGEKTAIAQDILKYTPANGGKAEIKIAAAPEIAVSETEKETSRETDTRANDGKSGEIINVDAEITIKNYKKEDVTILVNRSLTGEPVKSDIDWKITRATEFAGINPINKITWEITLKAGESRNIRYKYKISVDK